MMRIILFRRRNNLTHRGYNYYTTQHIPDFAIICISLVVYELSVFTILYTVTLMCVSC